MTLTPWLPHVATFLAGILVSFVILILVRRNAFKKLWRRAQKAQFTAYNPSKVWVGQWSPILVFTHPVTNPLEDSPTEVSLATQVEDEAKRELGANTINAVATRQETMREVPHLSELTFVPFVNGIEFSRNQITLPWTSNVLKVRFECRPKPEFVGQTLHGSISIYLGRNILASIPLVFQVEENQESTKTAAPPNHSTTALPFGKIFPSYSHKDEIIVNELLEYAKALGGQYFQDVIVLRTGEKWCPELKDKIDEADAFQLFWSRNAMASPNVLDECNYALSLKKPNFIYPTRWEEPFPRDTEKGLPPPELEERHFHRFNAPSKIVLFAKVLQQAWRSLKALPQLSIILLILSVGAAMAATFWAVDRAVNDGKNNPPPSSTPELSPNNSVVIGSPTPTPATPTPSVPQPTITPTPLPSPSLSNSVSPSPSPTSAETPTPSEQQTATPTPLAVSVGKKDVTITDTETVAGDIRRISIVIKNTCQRKVHDIRITHTLIGQAEFINADLGRYSQGASSDKRLVEWRIDELGPGESSTISIVYRLEGKSINNKWEWTVSHSLKGTVYGKCRPE